MKLLFLGDFFWDYEYIPEDFEDICRYIIENDYHVVLNLETTIGTTGKPIEKRGPNLRSNGNIIETLKKLNVIAVCMANNHTMDYGEEALAETLYLLKQANIQCVGAGKNLEDAQKELVLSVDEENVVLLNFGWDVEETVYASKSTFGCAPLDRNKIVALTKEIREKYPTYPIVNIFHWGFEYNLLPMPIDIKFAHDVIDAGADMIVGHHPHVIQPKEIWNEKNIYYSIGNFYFGSKRREFRKKFRNAEFENMCDYGAGIGYDVALNSVVEELIIEYDLNINRSYIKPIECLGIDDITGVEWESREYEKCVVNSKENINPVLNTDFKENQKKIRKLFFQYKVAYSLSFIKKSKIGICLFEQIKKILINR